MKKYFRIFGVLFKTSLIREMMFRANFILTIGTQAAWIGLYILVIHILFLHTQTIALWSKRDIIMLLGVWSTVDDLLQWVAFKNLRDLPWNVEQGTFDRMLTRPIDSQFLVSFERFDFSRFAFLAVDAGIIWYGFSLANLPFHFSMLAAPLLIFNGVAIGYALLLMLEALTFWFVRVDAIWALFHGMLEMQKYPLDIFGPKIKLIALTALPLAIMTQIPTEAILHQLPFLSVLYALAVAAFFLWISRKFYLFAVRRYSSLA